MATEFLPRYGAHKMLTCVASAAVVGGQTVKITGNKTVAPTVAAGEIVFGVAARDAAINAEVGVYPITGLLGDLQAVTTVAAGDTVGATATPGQIGTVVATASPNVCGVAVEAIAAGAKGLVMGGIG